MSFNRKVKTFSDYHANGEALYGKKKQKKKSKESKNLNQ